MVKEKRNITHHYESHNAEIPTLTLKIVKGNADFITENITLCSSGWSIEEAKDGMNYLIEKTKAMKNAYNKSKYHN